MKAILLTPALLLAVLLTGCEKRQPGTDTRPPQVTVSEPAREQVVDYLDLTGTVFPSRTVDLVARVSGYLRSADFADGALVEEGQTLFVIEPEPYEQQLRLAQAALLRAQSEYDRQVELSKENATSAASVERWLSERDQASAQVELARINLGYTRVTAPFRGRIGRRLVDPGNLVGPSVNTRLATLEQLHPIHVYFNLNERDTLRIWEAVRQSGLARPAGAGKTRVLVGLQTEEGHPHSGTLDFTDTAVSTATGTLPMRAVLQNEDKALFPGLFARVRIALGEPRPMLVVPNSAIGNDQEGDYVLVVDANDVAIRRGVVKGPLTPGGCAIRSGLDPADRVIVNGLMRTRPNAKVTPVKAARRPPAATPGPAPE